MRALALWAWLAVGAVVVAADGAGFPMLVGHRGAQGEGGVCENSMAAFRWSWDHRVKMVELDVRATADGVLVAMHDETVDRMTDGSGVLAEMGWDEVAQLGRSPALPAWYGECPVVRLEDVLFAARVNDGGMVLHVKEEETFGAIRALLDGLAFPPERTAILVDGVNAHAAAGVFADSGYGLWCSSSQMPGQMTSWWPLQLLGMGFELMMFGYAAGEVPERAHIEWLAGLGLKFGVSTRGGGANTVPILRAGTDVLMTNFPRRAMRFLGGGVALESAYLDWLREEQSFFVIHGGDVRPEADPDGDGLSNLLEMVLGTDPRQARVGWLGNSGVSRMPALVAGDGGRVFRYRVEEAALAGAGAGQPVRVAAERSHDGRTWQPAVAQPAGGGVYEVAVSGGTDEMFRLRVEDPHGAAGAN